MRTPTVAVTGAGGYIGGAVARAYADELGPGSVRCLVRSEDQQAGLRAVGFQTVVGDITDPLVAPALARDCAIVVHAAAKLGRAPRAEALLTNVTATRYLASECVRLGVRRFVFISSIEAYGAFAGRVLSEHERYISTGHVYAESKMLAERAVFDVYRSASSDAFTILRPGMVYGPHSEYWTHRYLRQAMKGRIVVLGNGGRIFPVFESDLVAAILTVGESGEAAGQVFNLVNDEGLTWWDWAWAHHRLAERGRPRRGSVFAARMRSWMRELSGQGGLWRKLEVELRSADLPHDKARDLLGWTPATFERAMDSLHLPMLEESR